jgi:hypothetical protein
LAEGMVMDEAIGCMMERIRKSELVLLHGGSSDVSRLRDTVQVSLNCSLGKDEKIVIPVPIVVFLFFVRRATVPGQQS